MHDHCVIAQYPNAEAARTGLLALEKDHYQPDDVSVITHQEHVASELERSEMVSPKGEQMSGEKAMGLGALIGGGVAGPIAATTLIGPFMVAGPLAGMAVGAVAGGLVGVTQRWNVSSDLIRQYESDVGEGAVLVVVHGEGSDMMAARRLLQTTSPTKLDEYAKAEHSDSKQ